MKKRHALTLSLLLGLSVVAGAFAAVRATESGGEPSATLSAAVPSGAQASLDDLEARFDAAIAQAGPASSGATATVAAQSNPQRSDDDRSRGETRGGDDDRYDDDGDHDDDDDDDHDDDHDDDDHDDDHDEGGDDD